MAYLVARLEYLMVHSASVWIEPCLSASKNPNNNVMINDVA